MTEKYECKLVHFSAKEDSTVLFKTLLEFLNTHFRTQEFVKFVRLSKFQCLIS